MVLELDQCLLHGVSKKHFDHQKSGFFQKFSPAGRRSGRPGTLCFFDPHYFSSAFHLRKADRLAAALRDPLASGDTTAHDLRTLSGPILPHTFL